MKPTKEKISHLLQSGIGLRNLSSEELENLSLEELKSYISEKKLILEIITEKQKALTPKAYPYDNDYLNDYLIKYLETIVKNSDENT